MLLKHFVMEISSEMLGSRSVEGIIPGDSVEAAVVRNGFYFIKEIKQSARRPQQEWTEFNLIATRGKKAKQSKSLQGQLLPLQ